MTITLYEEQKSFAIKLYIILTNSQIKNVSSPKKRQLKSCLIIE